MGPNRVFAGANDEPASVGAPAQCWGRRQVRVTGDARRAWVGNGISAMITSNGCVRVSATIDGSLNVALTQWAAATPKLNERQQAESTTDRQQRLSRSGYTPVSHWSMPSGPAPWSTVRWVHARARTHVTLAQTALSTVTLVQTALSTSYKANQSQLSPVSGHLMKRR